MKRYKSLVSVIIVIAVFIALFPNTVKAYTNVYRYKSAGSITVGQAITVKGHGYSSSGGTYTYTYYGYKLTIPSNGYIKVTQSNANNEVYLLPALSKCNTSKTVYENSITSTDYGEKTSYMVVNKGTYYLSSTEKTKLKVVFKEYTQTTNYCKAKATALKAGSTKVICMNKGYEFSRWYKISLTASKKITLTYKDLLNSYASRYPNFTIYNSAGKKIECPYLSGNNYRTELLAKGTYYVRVYFEGSYDDLSYDRLYTIKLN